MEVVAVKHAFTNEIILLKKNLNQAKTQTIHKLTRKAKTLTETKAPEAIKNKLKRKAESAVKEVLIIKKIKARDIARFIVTHTGKLNEYLNKPIVDNNKACARLLLHKAMQEKYNHIRGTFSNISIKDLFMSRQERLKLKKEARDKQKNKKKGNNSKTVNVEGQWDVEMTDTSKEKIAPNNSLVEENSDLSDNANNSDDDFLNHKDNTGDTGSGDDNNTDSDCDNDTGSDCDNDTGSDCDNDTGNDSDNTANGFNNARNKNASSDDNEEENSNKSKDLMNDLEINISKMKESNHKNNENIKMTSNILSAKNEIPLKVEIQKKKKKPKETKNKNLNEKLQKRKFNKECDAAPTKVSKMVDPFFMTSSGENYLSLVEPRAPDEVKEVHKQGNRRHRRAVMFGYEPRFKHQNPKEPRNSFKQDNFINNNINKIKFDSQNSSQFVKTKEPEEKLHPSWEAKKKISGIVPFKGKKIVFDES